MRRWVIGFVALAVLGGGVGRALASITITVPATSTVYFAGEDAASLQAAYASGGPGSTENEQKFWEDVANYLITLPVGIDVSGCPALSITATGTWDYFPTGWGGVPESALTGPDGDPNFPNYTTNSEYGYFGISLLTAPLGSLVGVFTGVDGPGLNDPFLIGASGTFLVPTGATTLYFGLHNGREWSDNSGSLEVTAQCIPEPSTLIIWSLLGLTWAGVAWTRRRRNVFGGIRRGGLPPRRKPWPRHVRVAIEQMIEHKLTCDD